VAVHVKQAERIRLVRAHLARPSQRPFVSAEDSKVRLGDGKGRPGGEGGGGACATGIFPLRFRWQAFLLFPCSSSRSASFFTKVCASPRATFSTGRSSVLCRSFTLSLPPPGG